jgi:hypothetical protein
MPQTWCKCHGCLALGPQGRPFSKADYKIHQLRLQREEQDRPLASQSAVENELFARSVADDDSVPFNAPSAMWNSREHIQAQPSAKSSSPESASTTTTASFVADSIRRLTSSSRNELSSPRGTDDLAQSLARRDIRATHIAPVNPAETSAVREADNLADSFDRLNIMGSHPPPITSSHVDTSDLPNVTDPSSSPVDSPAINRRLHARDKLEDNVHTIRALKTLNDIEQLMQECADKLVGSPTKSVRDDVANTVFQSRQKVEKVTRSTPQINVLKAKVAKHILHVENRVIELDTLFPSAPDDRNVPVEYSNGE